MPRVALHTLGCKLNYAETSTIGKQFLDQGYEIVPFGTAADVNVINTCSVTAKANQECRQMIRRALRAAPGSYVIVTGCYAQLAPEEVGAIEGVDLVAGTQEKFDLLTLAGDMKKLSCVSTHVSSLNSAKSFTPAWTTEAGCRTRAFLKVQDGCDYTCSFCTIPKARGGSRSESVVHAVERARRLVDEGFKEIVLTGVNVGDYGKKNGSTLAGLLRELILVRGLERIRISSIEPNLVTDEILDLIGDNSPICKHLHIPLQSGSDRILGQMRRRYRSADYAVLVDKIASRFPDCGIGA
ncbi:MAG TPA: MiaB/RimO family radical SAM methylthiotransferase, partial [Bacteroidota bacterium]|nr:MiaB/RimO family radical SAM methylthiotransferase [Bacteroidota bacterium]